jgi:hypothetical protein
MQQLVPMDKLSVSHDSKLIYLCIDLEEYVDLKSVSNYGWRVDLERIRSKYFVDMMRHKDDDSHPVPSFLGKVIAFLP